MVNVDIINIKEILHVILPRPTLGKRQTFPQRNFSRLVNIPFQISYTAKNQKTSKVRHIRHI